mgnify:CR=1 FL=1
MSSDRHTHNRRAFLKLLAAAGAGVALPGLAALGAAALAAVEPWVRERLS